MTLRLPRRTVLGASLALVAAPAFAQGDNPRVVIHTPQGDITVELEAAKAPITSANFLRYVDHKRFDGSKFFRAVRNPGAETTGIIEGGQNDPTKLYPPIAHESTTDTGLKHLDGTISMARFAPGSATAEFFICVGPSSYLDADPTAKGDNEGFAAFGQVTDGMDVVKTIMALPTNGPAPSPIMKGQILSPPVEIITMRRAA